MSFLAITMAALAIVGGYIARRRLGSRRGGVPRVTDDLVDQIETSGWVDAEEPLDVEAAQEEEERFWEETAWEEPEEW